MFQILNPPPAGGTFDHSSVEPNIIQDSLDDYLKKLHNEIEIGRSIAEFQQNKSKKSGNETSRKNKNEVSENKEQIFDRKTILENAKIDNQILKIDDSIGKSQKH